MPTFTNGNDQFTADQPGSYDLDFLAGEDRLVVLMGSVRALMGEGNDQITIRGGSALEIRGDAGSDRFNILTAVDGIALYGGEGNDRFYGYNNVVAGIVEGGAGNDIFYEFRGSTTTIAGGVGNDVYRLHPASGARFVENVDGGSDTVQVAVGDSYNLGENLENITVFAFANLGDTALYRGNALNNRIIGGGASESIYSYGGNDALYGMGGDDFLWGADGNDRLYGGTGTDELHGQDGSDILDGGSGGDVLIGGTDNDTYFVDDVADLVQELANSGADTVRTAIASYVLTGDVENGIIIAASSAVLRGNALDNLLISGVNNDQLHGLAGNDRLRGGDGGDRLSGGLGDDVLEGGASRDRITGDWGDDWLIGGDGGDFLIGGDGADRFIYFNVSESRPGFVEHSGGFDTLDGFDRGEDIFDLSRIDADTTQIGNQAFHLVDQPTGVAGQLWVVVRDWVQGDGTAENYFADIYGDVDGDGIADFQVSIDVFYDTELTAADFIL